MRLIDNSGLSKISHQFKSQFNSGKAGFFIDIFCLRPPVELYKLSHEKVQKRELMPKNAKKLKFLCVLLKYLTPLVLKEIVEKRYWKKNRFKSLFL